MKKVLIFVLIICLSLGQSVYALPEGENVVYGDAFFDRSEANTLNVNVATDKLIVEYPGFSIADDEAVHFYQPSSNSVALNRVVGADPSYIFGTLTANGKIFLVNPNGVLFAKGCKVDAAGLVASTLDISNDDFLNENYVFSGQGGSIVNEADISCPGGYAALLSETVQNSGVIESELGTIMLACGRAITLSLDPQGIISVVVDEQIVQNLENKDDIVRNTGELVCAGGKVVLTAKALDGIFDYAVNNEGIIRVDALTEKDGGVLLEANQRVRLSGKIDAGQGTVNIDCQGASFLGDITAAEGVYNMNGNDTTISGGTYSGNQHWFDDKNIEVIADITVNNGSITITADADGNDKGNFTQNAGTTITTTSSDLGDVSISGVNLEVKEITSAKSISLAANRDVTVAGGLSSAGAGVSIIANADGDNQGDFTQDSGVITTASAVLGGVSITGLHVTSGSISSAKDVTISADKDVTVCGNVSADNGAVTITANADGNNSGDFSQDSGTITTSSSALGDVSISGRDVTVNDIDSARDLNITAGDTLKIETGSGLTGENIMIRCPSISQNNIKKQITAVENIDLYFEPSAAYTGVYQSTLDTLVGSCGGDLGIHSTKRLTLMSDLDTIFNKVGEGVILESDTDINGTGSQIVNLNNKLITTGGKNLEIQSRDTNDFAISNTNAGAGTVTIFSEGKIIDASDSNQDVISNILVLSASGGIGSGNALETTVTNLQATNNTGGDIEISNTGNLTAQSVTNNADISLTASLDLAVSGEVNSTLGGVNLIALNGAIIALGTGPHLKAAADSFVSVKTTAGSVAAAFGLLAPASDVTVTLSGVLDGDRGFFTGSTFSDTLVVENTSSGIIYFNGAQIWPVLPPVPEPVPVPAPVPIPELPPAVDSDIVPYLASIMARKIDRGYLEYSDRIVILSSDQAAPHFYNSHVPLSIETSALGRESFGE